MTQAISKSRFKPHSLEYFRRIEKTGEALVITDHGKPVLKIIPFREDRDDWFKGLRNTVLRYDDPFEPVDSADWDALR